MCAVRDLAWTDKTTYKRVVATLDEWGRLETEHAAALARFVVVYTFCMTLLTALAGWRVPLNVAVFLQPKRVPH
jgi:hypothetical protein